MCHLAWNPVEWTFFNISDESKPKWTEFLLRLVTVDETCTHLSEITVEASVKCSKENFSLVNDVYIGYLMVPINHLKKVKQLSNYYLRSIIKATSLDETSTFGQKS